jgi:hypothetical protein
MSRIDQAYVFSHVDSRMKLLGRPGIQMSKTQTIQFVLHEQNLKRRILPSWEGGLKSIWAALQATMLRMLGMNSCSSVNAFAERLS